MFLRWPGCRMRQYHRRQIVVGRRAVVEVDPGGAVRSVARGCAAVEEIDLEMPIIRWLRVVRDIRRPAKRRARLAAPTSTAKDATRRLRILHYIKALEYAIKRRAANPMASRRPRSGSAILRRTCAALRRSTISVPNPMLQRIGADLVGPVRQIVREHAGVERRA